MRNNAVRVPAFDGAVIFFLLMPCLKVDLERSAWLDVFLKAGLLPEPNADSGTVSGKFEHEATLLFLLSQTDRIEVTPGSNPALAYFKEFVELLDKTDRTQPDQVKALWEARQYLAAPIVERWIHARNVALNVLVSNDPTQIREERLSEAEKVEAADPESPLAGHVPSEAAKPTSE